jgi:hypothetical protein
MTSFRSRDKGREYGNLCLKVICLITITNHYCKLKQSFLQVTTSSLRTEEKDRMVEGSNLSG